MLVVALVVAVGVAVGTIAVARVFLSCPKQRKTKVYIQAAAY